MTNLTLNSPARSYGDVLTTNNTGSGLDAILRPLQDGFGRNSTVTISTNSINFDRTAGNAFNLDSLPLDASATIMNEVCSSISPAFYTKAPLQLPFGTEVQRDSIVTSKGMIFYNTDSNQLEVCTRTTPTVWASVDLTPIP